MPRLSSYASHMATKTPRSPAERTHSRGGRPTLATVRKIANDHSTDTRSMMMPLAKNHHTYATTYTPISDQRILTHSMPAVRKAPAYSAIADRPIERIPEHPPQA